MDLVDIDGKSKSVLEVAGLADFNEHECIGKYAVPFHAMDILGQMSCMSPELRARLTQDIPKWAGPSERIHITIPSHFKATLMALGLPLSFSITMVLNNYLCNHALLDRRFPRLEPLIWAATAYRSAMNPNTSEHSDLLANDRLSDAKKAYVAFLEDYGKVIKAGYEELIEAPKKRTKPRAEVRLPKKARLFYVPKKNVKPTSEEERDYQRHRQKQLKYTTRGNSEDWQEMAKDDPEAHIEGKKDDPEAYGN